MVIFTNVVAILIVSVLSILRSNTNSQDTQGHSRTLKMMKKKTMRSHDGEDETFGGKEGHNVLTTLANKQNRRH